MTETANSFVITVGDHEDIVFTDQKNILSCLEQHNIESHYHCREGFCGACRTKLLSGQVNYTTDPLAYIDDDEFLPCCSVPNSNISIKVEY
ncbi:class I ribonucleotide reductase maintenance protein YfaE [Aliiglaciecola litoralis]|uniref:2Fe-2S ferredoxin-type domain-containing protein n=1 Tax=Aliiglaciecola litoralis TaxID=582857 RepID=A0ABN1LCD5_9ALTE